jgi:hypothetical protein
MLTCSFQATGFLFLTLAGCAWAGVISGSVVEDHTGDALVSAEVQVLRPGAKELIADLESGADGRFALLPADASTDAELAAAFISGQTDQYGQYTSGQLAPGKYFALATNASLDLTPETIVKLSQARTNAQPVDLQPNASVQISLVPADME